MIRGPEQRLDDIEDTITRIRAGMAALDSGVPDPQADLARDAVLYRRDCWSTCDEPLTALNDALPELRTAAATLHPGR